MNNMDFLEIQSFCGFDLKKAHALAKKRVYALREGCEKSAVEAMESQSAEKERRRLRCEGRVRRVRRGLV